MTLSYGGQWHFSPSGKAEAPGKPCSLMQLTEQAARATRRAPFRARIIHIRVRSYPRCGIRAYDARALLVEGRQPVTLV
jgi:hypothetical protein